MQFTSTSAFIATLLAASSVAAQSCPTVWNDVATDIEADFDGCTDSARAAIRMSFHDCFPGTCDGSLILAGECTDRGENTQMIDECSTLGDKATSFNVSTADMIQFAAAMGVKACAGPTISFLAGRVDSSTANAENQIPSPADNATTILDAFTAKGFDATELVALIGAHSAAKDLNGNSLDSTVTDMDTTFFTETADGSIDASLTSDKFLANSTETSEIWESMESGSTWVDAFGPAMEKLALMGNDEASLTDCSSIITDAFA
ncbi:heme peroxidase [Xylariaceae sp. FL0016]|nr:heme peroxidase [Xylariaceae sp. FL0016]